MRDGIGMGRCRLVNKTQRAILVDLPEYGERWVPNSQIHDDSEIFEESEPGEHGKLVVTDWFAEQMGWTY